MKNPWEEINLTDYEKHMSLDSVKQLQTMNSIMKDQFEAYTVDTVMVLGVAGGNGLEHIQKEKYKTVYAVDINAEYLRNVSERYAKLSDVLKCIHLDLIKDADTLPSAQLIIANLLIEYIGYSAFQKVIKKTIPEYVSCVIQINTDEEEWVSDSPYIHAFDKLDEIHHQMEGKALVKSMENINYSKIMHTFVELPNGKALERIDLKKIN